MRHPPKFVQAFIDRNGKPRFYFRRRGVQVRAVAGSAVVTTIYGSLRSCIVRAAVADWRE